MAFLHGKNAQEAEEKILNFIRHHNLCVVATVNSEQKPDIALMEFLIDQNLEIIVGTKKEYQKYKNLKNNPHTAIEIGFYEDITIQYQGIAKEIPTTNLESFQKNNVATRLKENKYLGIENDLVYFKITPTYIRYTDVSQGPWQHFEVIF